MPRLSAAEWTIAPTFSWSADDDSNRLYQPRFHATQSTTLSGSLAMQYATETAQFSFSPQVRWQYFDSSAFANIFERDLSLAASWSEPLGRLSLAARDSDLSSLTTEPTQTGILSSTLHQRLDNVTAEWDYSLSERRSLDLQLGYADVSYYGPPNAALLNLLTGYRYPTGSLGEVFQLTERSSLTASAFASELLSQLPDGNTRNAGGQLEYDRTLSERMQFDISAGAQNMSSGLSAQTSTVAALSLARSYSEGNLSLAFSRSVLPYGTGVLVLRQQLTFSSTYTLTPTLAANASILRVQNSSPGVQARLLPQIPTYETADIGLAWQPAETWKVNGDFAATRTRATTLLAPGSAVLGLSAPVVDEWRVGVSVSWTPPARSGSL